jgi:hypothetical protein
MSLAERRNMMEDRFLKRLRKKARKGLRGWPIATVPFYGPNLSQATKVSWHRAIRVRRRAGSSSTFCAHCHSM